MANSEHTPGPWEVSKTSILSKRHCIAVIENDGGYEAPSEQRVANALLIAAAPTLLEALQRIVAINGCSGGPQKLVDEFKFIASAAVARAKGGAQ